jgi:hypothetical protein
VAGDLDQAGVKAADFRVETVHLSTQDKIRLRGLFQEAGVRAKTGEEPAAALVFLRTLRDLASSAGGEPPMPGPPDVTTLDELAGLTGPEQLAAILERQTDVSRSVREWSTLSDRAEARLSVWEKAQGLRSHAGQLPIAQEVGAELDAIKAQRSLLADMDHVTPLVAKLTAALRQDVVAMHGQLAEAVGAATDQLGSDATWKQLDTDDQQDILLANDMSPPDALSIATDDRLLESLAGCSLSWWRNAIDAVGSRATQALSKAAERVNRGQPDGVTPITVMVQKGTLLDADAVDEWIELHRAKLNEAVAKGPVIVQ